MGERRRVIGEKRSLRVAVPPVIVEHFGLSRGSDVWWHLPWEGQAVLTATPDLATGYPDAQPLLRQLAAARAEIARLHHRDERFWRVRYAEGYHQGAISERARLLPPRTAGTEREDARRHAFEAAGAGRPRAAPLLQRVNLWTTRQPLELVAAPVLVLPDGVVALEQDEPG